MYNTTVITADTHEWIISTPTKPPTFPDITSLTRQLEEKHWTRPCVCFLIAFDQHTDHVTAGWIMGCARHWGAARLGYATNSIEAEGKVLLCAMQICFFFWCKQCKLVGR